MKYTIRRLPAASADGYDRWLVDLRLPGQVSLNDWVQAKQATINPAWLRAVYEAGMSDTFQVRVTAPNETAVRTTLDRDAQLFIDGYRGRKVDIDKTFSPDNILNYFKGMVYAGKADYTALARLERLLELGGYSGHAAKLKFDVCMRWTKAMLDKYDPRINAPATGREELTEEEMEQLNIANKYFRVDEKTWNMNDWFDNDHRAVRVEFLQTGTIFYLDMALLGPILGNQYNISGPKDVPNSFTDWQPQSVRDLGLPTTLTP